jgi:hypothetical protein
MFLIAAVIVVGLSSLAAGTDLTDHVRKSRQDLTNASIVAPLAGKTSTADLDRAIERLRNVRLKPKAEPPAPPEPAPAPAPEKSVPVAPKPPEQKSPKPAAAPAPSDEFARVPPDRIANPLALADALYMGGRLSEAYTFYERTLKGDQAPEVKAWALFQMANCRRAADPEAAAALYRRVSIECTGSPWVGVAAAQEKLIQWYQTMRPQTTDAGGKATGPTPAAGPRPAGGS